MSRGPHSFKQTDVTRVVKAVRAAGVEVARVEADIKQGKVVIFAGKPVDASGEATTNEWDEVNGGNPTKARQ